MPEEYEPSDAPPPEEEGTTEDLLGDLDLPTNADMEAERNFGRKTQEEALRIALTLSLLCLLPTD